jgi:hypothetical protein
MSRKPRRLRQVQIEVVDDDVETTDHVLPQLLPIESVVERASSVVPCSVAI